MIKFHSLACILYLLQKSKRFINNSWNILQTILTIKLNLFLEVKIIIIKLITLSSYRNH